MDHVMFYKYEIRIRLTRIRLFVEVMNSFTNDYLQSKKNRYKFIKIGFNSNWTDRIHVNA